jgi:uncharacterized SAM-binding protein YcdF (DUF218 family)
MRSLIALAVILLIWGIGLIIFADRIVESTPAVEPDMSSDAIVALTGKSDMRIKEGMRLLERRKGRRLLISGVNVKATRKEILAIAEGSTALYDCCVDLGYEAADTVGNAQEIANWAKPRHFTDIIVVTSDYHMPRALVEIKGVMPQAKLHPYPIATPDLDARTWWKSGKSLSIIVMEYNKYLIILGRDLILNISKTFGDGPKDKGAVTSPVPTTTSGS